MNYSFSTILMAVLASNLLIAIIALCFRNRKIMFSVGYKLVIVFLLLTPLRFFLPFEMPFSRNIYFPGWLSPVIASARHVFISCGVIQISAVSLLGCVWAGGMACCFLRDSRSRRIFKCYIRRYARNVGDREPYPKMMARVCGRRRNPFDIMEAPYAGPPMQYGTIRPCIVLPNTMVLSEEELYYVLRHEAAHYYHHDSLIKGAIRLVCAFYWWNPFCGSLKHRADLLLEMRVDGALIDGDAKTRDAYCRTLDGIRSKLKTAVAEPVPGEDAAVSMSISGVADLHYRESMMCRESGKRSPYFYLLAVLAAVVYIGSYCFTFEAYAMFPQDEEISSRVNETPFYAVPREDGTYDLYYGGVMMENVDTLEKYIGIEIRKE